MATFHRLYNPEDTLWNIYLQFVFADLESDSPPSLSRLIEWFQQHPSFEGFPGDLHQETIPLTNVTERSIREIPFEHGIEFVELTIKHAVDYSSNERLMPGQARSIAEAFMAEFESPLVFCNQSRSSISSRWSGSYGNVTDAERGYTWEYFLCCIDRKRIGFVFSLNNE